MESLGVSLISPLISGGDLIGVVGLGEKVNKKPLSASELTLLRVLLDSVTPLISYSCLFAHVSNLNNWFIEILDSVKHGVLVFDKKDKLMMINNPGARILRNINPELPPDTPMTGLQMNFIFSERTLPGWLDRLARCRTRLGIGLPEILVARYNGSDLIFSVSVSKIHSSTTEGSDIAVTIDDITEMKKNEHQIFELQTHAELGMMASSIAHELNNFLGMILGGIELLQIHIEKGNKEKIRIALDQNKMFISQMARFTAGLMDMNKLSSKKQDLNINSLIMSVISFVSLQKKFNSIVVQADIDQTLPLLNADRDQITQLILNFISNAADAMNEARREKGLIIVKTASEQDRVILSISDNGIGIRPDLKEKLFKSRFTTKTEGHGYGLLTCSRIIKDHGAQVGIESAPEKGTTFKIGFPLKSQPINS